MPYKKYIFEITLREEVIAESEADAKPALPPKYDGALSDWVLVNVEDA